MSKGNNNHYIDGGEKEEVDGGVDIDVDALLETSGVFSRLVPDIFLNIMSRVPLRSLSQCKWVCKSWYRLIKSPSFAKIQYEWAMQNNSPWVFFWSCKRIFYLVDDQVFDNLQTSITAHRLELNGFDEALEFYRIIQTASYANGLICIAADPSCYHPSSIYVCNPITGEHIIIPKSAKYMIPAITAFGFNPATNEYKVIRFINYEDEDGEYSRSEGEVYTLGSSEWRKLEDVPHITDLSRSGVLLNGNLHWLLDNPESPIIDVLNVGSEKFDVFQPPPFSQKSYGYERLGVIEGDLCFLHKNPYCSKSEIWVMEDYGVQTSWLKKYSFNSCVERLRGCGSNDLIKLRTGEFLLQVKDKDEFMGYFDPIKDTLRPISIIGDRETHHLEDYFQSVVQVGSLFSPKDVGQSRRVNKCTTQDNGGNFLAEETRGNEGTSQECGGKFLAEKTVDQSAYLGGKESVAQDSEGNFVAEETR